MSGYLITVAFWFGYFMSIANDMQQRVKDPFGITFIVFLLAVFWPAVILTWLMGRHG